jgi:hypothetical protein
MKKTWIALALALALTGTLTACGSNGTTNGTAMDQTGNTGGGTTVGRASNTIPGASGGSTGWSLNKEGNGESQRTAPAPRTARDYLNDGRYQADGEGRLGGQTNSASRDLTQGARDIVRDAGDAAGDMMSGVGSGVRRATDDLTGQDKAQS